MKIFWLAATAAAALFAALPAAAQTAPAAAAQASAAARPGPSAPALTEAPRMGPWGFDLAGRDTSVSPGQNFFKYANGTYQEHLVIPPDRSRFGAFDVLNEVSQNRMRAVLDQAAADPEATGERAK